METRKQRQPTAKSRQGPEEAMLPPPKPKATAKGKKTKRRGSDIVKEVVPVRKKSAIEVPATPRLTLRMGHDNTESMHATPSTNQRLRLTNPKPIGGATKAVAAPAGPYPSELVNLAQAAILSDEAPAPRQRLRKISRASKAISIPPFYPPPTPPATRESIRQDTDVLPPSQAIQRPLAHRYESQSQIAGLDSFSSSQATPTSQRLLDEVDQAPLTSRRNFRQLFSATRTIQESASVIVDSPAEKEVEEVTKPIIYTLNVFLFWEKAKQPFKSKLYEKALNVDKDDDRYFSWYSFFTKHDRMARDYAQSLGLDAAAQRNSARATATYDGQRAGDKTSIDLDEERDWQSSQNIIQQYYDQFKEKKRLKIEVSIDYTRPQSAVDPQLTQTSNPSQEPLNKKKRASTTSIMRDEREERSQTNTQLKITALGSKFYCESSICENNNKACWIFNGQHYPLTTSDITLWANVLQLPNAPAGVSEDTPPEQIRIKLFKEKQQRDGRKKREKLANSSTASSTPTIAPPYYPPYYPPLYPQAGPSLNNASIEELREALAFKNFKKEEAKRRVKTSIQLGSITGHNATGTHTNKAYQHAPSSPVAASDLDAYITWLKARPDLIKKEYHPDLDRALSVCEQKGYGPEDIQPWKSHGDGLTIWEGELGIKPGIGIRMAKNVKTWDRSRGKIKENEVFRTQQISMDSQADIATTDDSSSLHSLHRGSDIDDSELLQAQYGGSDLELIDDPYDEI